MRRLWWLVGLVVLGLACGVASAQNSAIQGYCQNGGVKVTTSGSLSTNTVQASYPKCLVTVFLTGTTTPATLYSNAGGTPLSNPFTANTNGFWLFFAADGTGYDVTLSGGTPIPLPFPVTLTDIVIGGGGSGTGCIPSGATNSLQKNNGSGGCAASSVIDNGTTVSTTEPVTAPAVNTVINAGSSLSTAVTACGSANTTIQITQTIAVSSGITVPKNCTLLFQSAGNLTGTSITINGAVQAANAQIFGSGLAVTFGTAVNRVPIEWFGGKNDATGSVGVGTDNLTAFNAAIAALNAGQIIIQPSTGASGYYRISGPIAIAKPSVGISGVQGANYTTGFTAAGNGSTILIDSASADAIDVNPGTSWNQFLNFNIYRTQLATGTAAGLAIYGTSHPIGIRVDGVMSTDSMNDFYTEGQTSFGPGDFTNNQASWQVNGLVGSSPSGACGFLLDSNTLTGYTTLLTGPNSAITGGTGVGQTGLCIKGVNVSDVIVDGFIVSTLDYGIDIESTGTSNNVAGGDFLTNVNLGPVNIAGIKINGAASATDVGPHVTIGPGSVQATGAGAVGIVLENSTNITVDRMQMSAGFTGSAAQTDVTLSNVQGFQITNNQFDGESLVNVSCLNSSQGTINHNQIRNGNNSSGNVGIKMVGCTRVAIQGNTIAGAGGSPLTTGISFDSGSSNNGPWSLNAIDSSTVTTPVSDAGTNNNTMSPTILNVGNITLNTNGFNVGTGDFTFSNFANLFLGGSSGTANINVPMGNTFDIDGAFELSTLSGCLSANASTHIVSGNGSACGSGGSGITALTGDVTASGTGSVAATVKGINGTLLSGLATGIYKNTTGTGVPSIAVAADFPTLNQSTTGNAATATLATGATNLVGGVLGSSPYQSAPSTTLFVAPNTTTAKEFYSETGTGSVGASPAWGVLASGDIPNNAANTSGNAATATNLASYPTLCTGGQFSQGLSAASNNCGTPAGGGPGTGTAFSVAYWATSSTLGSLATPPTGTLWWLGTSSAPRASTTGDTAALSISGNAATATNGAVTNAANTFVQAGTGIGNVFTQFTGATTTCANNLLTFAVGSTNQGCLYRNTGTSFFRFGVVSGGAVGGWGFDQAVAVVGAITASGTITSNLGTAAITSATGGTGVTSVTCATAACNVSRGSYTVVGGSATTGTIITLVWPTTATAWVCSVDENGGIGFLGLGHSVATATGMNITAGVTVAATTFTVDYNCVP